MKILSAIAVLGAMLVASSSLQAALFTQSSVEFYLSGTMADDSDSYRDDSTDRDSFGSRSFTLTIDPSYPMVLAAQASLSDLSTSGSLAIKLSHSGGSPYTTTFELSSTVILNLGGAGLVTFTIPSFAGDFSGSVSISLDGQSVANGEAISLTSGEHYIDYYIIGGREPGTGSLTDFAMVADFTAVPEPGTWAMLACGAIVARGIARRQRISLV